MIEGEKKNTGISPRVQWMINKYSNERKKQLVPKLRLRHVTSVWTKINAVFLLINAV